MIVTKRETKQTQGAALRHKSKKDFKLFLYVLPCIALIWIFKYKPLEGWAYALYDYKPGYDLADCRYVGLENFKFLFSNPLMLKQLMNALKNTFGINLLGYLFSPLPMFFAVFLSEIRSKKFQKVVQTVTSLPNFVSWVIMFSLASSMFGSNGFINSVLTSLGMDPIPNILMSSDNVWLTQVLLQQWKSLGWSAIVYFAAIAGCDQTIYEAASVDGANRMQRMWHITLPQLIPTYFVLLVMHVGHIITTGVDQYMIFSTPMNMESIQTLDLYIYNIGMGSGRLSYAVAVGLMQSVVAIIMFSITNLASKKIRGTSVF